MKGAERLTEGSPRDPPTSPGAGYRGCVRVWGSWEGSARHTPGGAYGTRRAAGAQTGRHVTVERETEGARNRANLSEHVFQGEVIKQQLPRIHQPLVFGALHTRQQH